MRKAIRKERRAAKLTQQELADAVGVSRQMVIMWEQGAQPTFANLRKLSKAFGKPLHQWVPDEVA